MMRLVRYSLPQESRIRSGVVEGKLVRPLVDDRSLADAVANGCTLEGDAELVRLQDIRLECPVDTPPSIRDFISFEDHARSAYAALGRSLDPIWYEQPVFFFSNPAASLGPRADVAISPGSESFDFEVEIAAVIGKPGQNIPVSAAEEHIAGYSLFCDWSARDLQARETRVGLGPAKGKDSASTFGPYLVMRDEIEHLRAGKGYDIELSVSVNGKEYGRGNWSSIYWSFAQMISYASRGTELRTGDVIGGGTIGTCSILERAGVHPYLRSGDLVHIEAGPLGAVTPTIIAGVEPHPL